MGHVKERDLKKGNAKLGVSGGTPHFHISSKDLCPFQGISATRNIFHELLHSIPPLWRQVPTARYDRPIGHVLNGISSTA